MRKLKNRPMIYLTAVTAALLTLLSLSACSREKPPERQVITELSAARPAFYPMLVDLGGGKAAICWTERAEDGGRTTCIDVIDAVRDEKTGSMRLADSFGIYGSEYDGGLMLYSSDCLSYVLVDSDLNTVRSVTMPDKCYGEPSYDLTCFYYVSEGYLFRMDTATGESVSIPLPGGMRAAYLKECSAKADLLTVYVYTDRFETETCCGVLDCLTGEFVLLGGLPDAPGYDRERFGMASVGSPASGDTDDRFKVMTWGTNDGGVLKLRSVTERELHHPEGWDYECLFDSSSRYIVCNHSMPNEETGDYNHRTFIYSAGDSVEFCDLARYGYDNVVRAYEYMPDINAILVCGGYDTDTNDCPLYLIDLGQTEFSYDCEPEAWEMSASPDSSIWEKWQEDCAVSPVSDGLADLRARADMIEEHFGVTILLSDQCRSITDYSGYEAKITSSYDTATERRYISAALDAAETALSMYPQGFFRQFRDRMGAYGVRILLTGPLTGEAGAVGVQFNYSNWYNIMMDIQFGIQTGTLCHEIWHATESRLSDEAAAELNDGSWDACNPEGFEYYGDYDTDSREDWDRWLYAYDPDNAYFVDTYAKTYAAEDRARIMEFVMGDPQQADILMQSPHVRRKLEILCRAMRAGFDTTGWDNVPWERYLPAQNAEAADAA